MLLKTKKKNPEKNYLFTWTWEEEHQAQFEYNEHSVQLSINKQSLLVGPETKIVPNIEELVVDK